MSEGESLVSGPGVSEPVLTNSERALKAAMVALDYIASQAGLYHSNSIDQARQAKAAIEDILGSPSQVPTAEQEIEELRTDLITMRKERDILQSWCNAYKDGSEYRTLAKDCEEAWGIAADMEAQAKSLADSATKQRERGDLLEEMLRETRVYAASLSDRLYIHEASDAFKRQQLLALSQKKGKKAKKCDQSRQS